MIDFYFAGCEELGLANMVISQRANMLLSYYNMRSFDKWKENYLKSKLDYKPLIILDSGAYSAWTRKVIIDCDKYIHFLNTNEEWFTLYGQLDVIPGVRDGLIATPKEVEEAASRTWENYLYMRSKLVNPLKLLYTFHVGEPLNKLKEALEWKDEKGRGMKYMALGGMVGKSSFIRKQFLRRCFELIKNSSNPQIKIHAFGMTSLELMEQFPITSVDSTSWIMTGVNGQIKTDSGIVQISELTKHRSTSILNCKPSIESLKNLVEKYEIPLHDLITDYKARNLYHVKYYKDKALNLKRTPDLKTRKKLF